MYTDKLLVTGSTGFLGRHVIEELINRGYTNIEQHKGSQHVDLRDFNKVRDYLYLHNPDIVIHLAARVGGIGANSRNPGSFLYDNLAMGANIIEVSRCVGVKKFILLSTICSYPKDCPTPFKEEDIWNGYPEETNAPYGIAKKTLMEMLKAYKKEYNFNGITLIPTNLFGEGDDFNINTCHVIPAMIYKMHMAKVKNLPFVELWGTGSATREFLYVKDCARAIVNSVEIYNDSEPINLGVGQDMSIKDLALFIKSMVGYNGIIVWNPTKPDGQPKRLLDISKAEKYLGWRVDNDITPNLRKTYSWFMRHIK